MTRPRHGRPKGPRPGPPRPAFGTLPLGTNSGRIVLLGLVAAEGVARCREHREQIRQTILDRITQDETWSPSQAQRWRERLDVWRPVTCEIEFMPTSTVGTIAAPMVSFVARRDDDSEMMVRYTLCQRGLIRMSPKNWPDGLDKPLLPADPEHLADAINWSRMAVGRVLPPLLAFVDPTRD